MPLIRVRDLAGLVLGAALVSAAGCSLDDRVLMVGRPDAGGYGGGAAGGGTGGASAGGAGGGSAGSGGAPSPDGPLGVAICTGVPPATPRITGSPQSAAATTPITFGAVGLPVPVVTRQIAPDGISLGGFTVSASLGTAPDAAHAWVGFGLPFVSPSCVDASVYTGVQFHVTGDLGTCGLRFSIAFSADNSVANGPVGACTINGCTSPSTPVPLGTIAISFGDLSGGVPVDRLDATTLNDVLWFLDVPTDPSVGGCTVNLAFDNIAFFQ